MPQTFGGQEDWLNHIRYLIPGAKNCSVISAEYSLGDRPIGTIGLIGPQRINYSRVISIMAQVMKELNDMLKGQGLD